MLSHLNLLLLTLKWLREQDSNLRPSGYEPDELPAAPSRDVKKEWWRGLDSNQRSRRRQIYSLLPLATREPLHVKLNGAGEKNRTPNLLITSQLLYQLSYASAIFVMISRSDKMYYIIPTNSCQPFLFTFLFTFSLYGLPAC